MQFNHFKNKKSRKFDKRNIQHSLWTLNMRLNRLTFYWILTKLHVDYFSVNQSLLTISEGVLLSNLTYIFINVSCMHCFSLFSCIFNIRVTVNMRFNHFLLNKTRMHWTYKKAPKLNMFMQSLENYIKCWTTKIFNIQCEL